jgi:asparagine synthase (glutamine-hydrolysing)
VTVALSGDGGDELFAGYHHYRICASVWRRLSMAPGPLRNAAADAIRHLPAGLTSAMGSLLPGVSGRQLRMGRLQRIGQVLGAKGPDDLYRRIISQWHDPAQVVTGAAEYNGEIWDEAVVAAIPDFIPRMQYYDSVQYLPDDVLTKVDRASMAVSLETRLPLLDYRVLAFAWRLPMSMKMGEGGGKWILRKLLARYLPPELFERPKLGFGVPIDAWLRGELRQWAGDLLAESRLRADGFFDPAPILAAWRTHLAGDADLSYMIWTILMFQQWLHETKA